MYLILLLELAVVELRIHAKCRLALHLLNSHT